MNTVRVITARIDDSHYNELKELVKSGEFDSISSIIRAAILDFLRKRRLRWRSRKELRDYLLSKRKKFRASGEIIEEIRREED